MGVPAFFRWLSRKYPTVIVSCIEEMPKIIDGVEIPVDISLPNPNCIEFDNLYLDMNSIIHPCCHPEYKTPPKDEEEMMEAIFEYIDRIFSIVRPRKLLYIAIDGVAPRAKMNQQRSRRFRAPKEHLEKVQFISRLREKLIKGGAQLPSVLSNEEQHFDSNCITPGTPFMTKLAKALDSYIRGKIINDKAWHEIAVILSDSNVPGEGEHKIMEFIRQQKLYPEYDPTTRHCLYGADADLIMLGLASHEPSFTIIREELMLNQPKPCELCGQFGHEVRKCTGIVKEKKVRKEEKKELSQLKKPVEADSKFIFVRLNVLKEKLAAELFIPNLSFPFVLERVIDDWIFLCLFVGNDFLPHLPSLEIRDQAIERLIEIYKEVLPDTDGFLTNNGDVELKRVELIMKKLAEDEEEILKTRYESQVRKLIRKKQQKRKKKQKKEQPDSSASTSGSSTSGRKKEEGDSTESSQSGVKRKREDGDSAESSESEPEPKDDIRLGENGWKERYYKVKFNVDDGDIMFRHKVAAAYVEGICWVLRYYYKGCPSWNWFFPYHYAPFPSDFVNIGDLKIDFVKGKPFNPLEQLMAVFPTTSKQHVPESWGRLMCDPASPIIDFYPENFSIDLNGNKHTWQGVALLPFVDEKRLLNALQTVYNKLTPAEIERNSTSNERFYFKQGELVKDFSVSMFEKGPKWKKFNFHNIVLMMKENKIEDPEELVEPVAVGGPKVEDEDEPELPEDFEYLKG